mmetsp:Transcript_20436/g.69260  ORF Transcript_20436/g.69260 Transcript_20436/m.69260 type:complete len:232 (-) Transcript_20436:297-992(-)
MRSMPPKVPVRSSRALLSDQRPAATSSGDAPCFTSALDHTTPARRIVLRQKMGWLAASRSLWRSKGLSRPTSLLDSVGHSPRGGTTSLRPVHHRGHSSLRLHLTHSPSRPRSKRRKFFVATGKAAVHRQKMSRYSGKSAQCAAALEERYLQTSIIFPAPCRASQNRCAARARRKTRRNARAICTVCSESLRPSMDRAIPAAAGLRRMAIIQSAPSSVVHAKGGARNTKLRP